MVRRLAIRFAYFGPDFEGYARQPGMHTVEGEVAGALRRIQAWREGDFFMSSSRTDRGVSARANVLAFDTDFDPEALPRALDSALSSVILRSVAVMPDGANPRHARSRTYTYRMPDGGGREVALGSLTARAFVGEHDFSAFCRHDERGSRREVLECELTADAGGPPTLRVVGRSFLWQQVRRMAGAVDASMRGETTPEAVAEALRTGVGSFPPLPPEPLTLEKVDVPGLEWRDFLGRKGREILETERSRWGFYGSIDG